MLLTDSDWMAYIHLVKSSYAYFRKSFDKGDYSSLRYTVC